MAYEGLNGDTYKYLADLARAYNIGRCTLEARLKNGMKLEEALKTPVRSKGKECVGLNNDKYKTIKELAKAYGVSYNALKNRVNKGMSTDEALKIIIKKSEVRYEGLNNDTHKTIMDLAKAYGIKYDRLKYKTTRGMSTDEALRSLINESEVRYEGLNNDKYKTIRDLAKAYGLDSDAIYTRMSKQGLSAKEALISALSMPYEGLHGDRYKSVRKLAKQYELNYGRIKYAMQRGKSAKEAIEQELEKKNKFYCDNFGNKYNNFKQLVIDWGMKEGTISYRLANGIELCVALVVKDNMKLKFVGLDGKARYILNGAEDKLYTARELIKMYRPDLLDAYDKYNPKGEYKLYKGCEVNGK